MIEEVFDKYYAKIACKFMALEHAIHSCSSYTYHGKIISATGSIIIATIPLVKIGDLCIVEDKAIDLKLYAEVVAINGEEVKLLPFGSINSLSSMADIYCISDNFTINVSNEHIGKIVSGLGKLLVVLIICQSLCLVLWLRNSPLKFP
jgi:type III secretion protein N (ATPase)